MLYRPKKVNKGFDRIFLVMAIIGGISLGFYVGINIGNTETRESIWDFLPEYSTWKIGETKEEEEIRTKQWEAIEKAKPLAHERLRERKRQLEKQGYRVSFVNLSGKQRMITKTSDPNAPAIFIYPPISKCLPLGALSAGISFLIILFSLRGLTLLILWIKEGFNDN